MEDFELMDKNRRGKLRTEMNVLVLSDTVVTRG